MQCIQRVLFKLELHYTELTKLSAIMIHLFIILLHIKYNLLTSSNFTFFYLDCVQIYVNTAGSGQITTKQIREHLSNCVPHLMRCVLILMFSLIFSLLFILSFSLNICQNQNKTNIGLHLDCSVNQYYTTPHIEAQSRQRNALVFI